MKKRIAIFIETDNGQVKPANLGMLTLADPVKNDLFAIVVNADVKVLQKDLETAGAARIIHVDLPKEMQFNPQILAQIVMDIMAEYDISDLFGLSSAQGKNLLPRIAAGLDAPLIMDCVFVDLEKGTAKTSQYSGKTMATFQVTGPVRIFGIRPNTIKMAENKVSAQILHWDRSPAASPDLKVLNIGQEKSRSEIVLTEADIIIAGGRGMKNPDNFSVLFDCAKKMNAAVAASRVAVDSGWVPYAMQVGQTGEKVSPKVYIACGISGSIQHFAGMKTSGMVIAVNTDENAAIVSNADYFAIGDATEVITQMNNILDNG